MSTQRLPTWLPGILNPHLIAIGLLTGALTFKTLYLGDLLGLALHNGSLTYTEGVNAILATRIDLWFHPLETSPHFPTIYPLLYHAIINAITTVLPLGVFQVIHLTAITAAFLTGGVIYRLLTQHGISRHTALAGGLLYALSPTVTGGTVLGRVDHLGVLFGMLAVLAATRPGRWRPIHAAAWTIPCMYVKQSLIAFPIAIAAWYWLNDERLDAITYTSWTAVIGLGILGALTTATNGRAYHHLITLNASQDWSLMLALSLAAWVGFVHIAIASGSLATLIHSRAQSLPVILFTTTLLAGIALAGKPGAWTGYYLPAIAAGAILLATGIDQYVTRWNSTRGLLIILALSVQFGLFAAWQPAPEYDPADQDMVVEYLEGVEGPIVSEDNGLLVRLDREREPYESQLIRSLPEERVPPGASMASEFRRGEYAAVVLTTNVSTGMSADGTRWSQAEFRGLDAGYRLVLRVGNYSVYRPRT